MGAGRPVETDELEILRLKQSGMTNKQIAEYLFIHPTTVSKKLAQFRDEYKDITKKNKQYKKIDLTQEQINMMKRMKASGYSLTDISLKTGLSRTFISKILKNN